MFVARRKVLTLLKDGKISVLEAEEMLEAVGPHKREVEFIPKITILGESEATKRVREQVQEYARTESPVLIFGESGTGKAVIAKSIHVESHRAPYPFVGHFCEGDVALNDVEIFGAESGEAGDVKRGLLEMGNGGTLFLDSVSYLSPETQYRLHSYLKDGYFTRVNGVKPVYADVRVVAATNRDLEAEVEAGRFRADLLDQLNVCVIKTAPVREYPEDILLFARHFAEQCALRDGKAVPDISQAVLDKLMQYHWPRNVAEIHRVIETAVLKCEGETLLVEHLPELPSATYFFERPKK